VRATGKVSGPPQCFQGQSQDERSPLRLHGRDHRRNAHYLHHAGHIVGKHMQRHFRGDVFQLSHLEVGGTHPRFDRAVWTCAHDGRLVLGAGFADFSFRVGLNGVPVAIWGA